MQAKTLQPDTSVLLGKAFTVRRDAVRSLGRLGLAAGREGPVLCCLECLNGLNPKRPQTDGPRPQILGCSFCCSDFFLYVIFSYLRTLLKSFVRRRQSGLTFFDAGILHRGAAEHGLHCSFDFRVWMP